MATPDQSRLIAQSIDVPAYALDLSTLAPPQMVYNGKCTYIAPSERHPPLAGWCHLLLLRGTSRWLAVITQTPDCDISVVNTIEHIASFVLSFFTIPPLLYRSTSSNEGEENTWKAIDLTPENITFVQYLPARCFSIRSSHEHDEYAIMKFSWEERQANGRQYFQAGKPADSRWVMGMWQHAEQEDINNLIRTL